MNHMLHGAVTRIGGAIKRIEGADGAKYSPDNEIPELYIQYKVFRTLLSDIFLPAISASAA